MSQFSDFKMFLYLTCAILSIYSATGAVIQRSVFQAIQDSSNDLNFKCPYLRSTNLFNNEMAENILKDCPNFKQAQSLIKIDEHNLDKGLCILYFNNFGNVCYLTNDFTKYDKLENKIPSLFTNIDVVCKTLINNTHFLNNIKPGIEAITERLRSGSCNRLCTDLDGNIKPICSLSAYLTNITDEILKDRIAKTNSIVTEQPKIDSSLGHLNEIAQQGDGNQHKETAAPGDLRLQTEKLSPELTTESPKIDEKKTADTDHNIQDLESPYSNKKIALLTQPQIAISTSPQPIPKINLDSGQQQDGKSSPMGLKVTNIGSQQVTVTPVKPENVFDINKQQEAVKLNLEQNGADTAHKQASHNTDNKTPNNHRSKEQQPDDIQDMNTNKQLQPDIQKSTVNDRKSVPVEELNKQPIQKNDKSVIDKDSEEREIGGREGETQPDGKEEIADNDIQIEEGLVSVGDGNMDYGNEISPKSSEVKFKTEEEKSPGKFKPLQTDERYTVAANYQNQNIDDSDSYFFSYFMMFCIIFICGYVAYHNKQKILALVIEGRRGRRPSRTRRPNSANYHKLDSNLEEAVTSTCNKNATQVIY